MTEPKVILSKGAIVERAKEKWNSKGERKRLMCGKKYQHIFESRKLEMTPWTNNFEKLTHSQKSILIKGELIRTYDSLANSEKTELKRLFGLERFSSKWFKLAPKDKKLLLNSVLNQ